MMKKWTADTISKAAEQCSTWAQFYSNYPGAYAAASCLGILHDLRQQFAPTSFPSRPRKFQARDEAIRKAFASGATGPEVAATHDITPARALQIKSYLQCGFAKGGKSNVQEC